MKTCDYCEKIFDWIRVEKNQSLNQSPELLCDECMKRDFQDNMSDWQKPVSFEKWIEWCNSKESSYRLVVASDCENCSDPDKPAEYHHELMSFYCSDCAENIAYEIHKQLSRGIGTADISDYLDYAGFNII
jgi:hypothetical protein